MENGLTQIYWGNGKGKTTSALGTALRALNKNYKVHLVQFMKNQASNEVKSLEKFENFSYKPFEQGSVKQAFDYLKSCLTQNYDLIIADEILYAIQFNLLTEEQVIDLIKSKPKNTELILTGSHKSFPKIFELADYVTEVKKVKHPFDKGIKAREGVEY